MKFALLSCFCKVNASLPSWERGLKFLKWHAISIISVVAPLVGAWIEIEKIINVNKAVEVAPLVGAWIEILSPRIAAIVSTSLPSWERGLKFGTAAADKEIHKSLPSWERGLKSSPEVPICVPSPSLPSWERGLKLLLNGFLSFENWSLPSWERGLKS